MRPWTLVAVFAGLASAQGLPDNEGRALYERVCGACHGADIVIGSSNTKEGWTDLVDAMKDRGAEMNADEHKTIVDYLVRNFGPKPAAPKPAKPK
jgi:mono/diheme cytochrome c family protein